MDIEELTIDEITEKISNLFEEKKYSQIKESVAEMNSADIALIF